MLSVLLVLALVSFLVGAVLAGITRGFWALALCLGLAFWAAAQLFGVLHV